MGFRGSLLAGAVLLAGAGAANAALLTTEVGYTGMGLDLSAYATGDYNFTFGPKPIPGGITFTRDPSTASNSGDGAVLGQGGYGLGANGSFGGDAVYAGLDGAEGWMRFTFDTAQTSFGVFANYSPGSGPDPMIRVLRADLSVIEEYNLAIDAPISTPGGFNEFAFRGIASSESFMVFEMSNSYIIATGTPDGVPVVPEPETYALMLLGLGTIGVVARRRKRG